MTILVLDIDDGETYEDFLFDQNDFKQYFRQSHTKNEVFNLRINKAKCCCQT